MIQRAIAALVLIACASACGATAPSGQGSSPGSRESGSPRTLVISITEDPRNFWDGINGGGGSGARELGHLVNQYLAVIKPDGSPEPRLLASLPVVGSDDWVVNPDGTMLVTYRLRPGVNWHDGVAFTAEDVAFSWKVGRDPSIANGNQSAVKLISDVQVLDPQTAAVTWSEPYPFADRLEHREFFPLPAHVLETAYQQDAANLIGQPYFTDEYVGTGPFKVSHWEHGSQLELVANDNYFLGRPKIDRMTVQFIADPNTMLANLQSGSLNAFLPPGGPGWDGYQPLRQEWAASGRGQIVPESVRWAMAEIQKSTAAQPSDLADARVRRALMVALDRKEIAQTIIGDIGIVADSWVSPQLSYYPKVESNITHFAPDARQSASLLAEAGWTPGPDGTLQKGGTPFQMTMTYTNHDGETAASIMQQDLKGIGVSTQLTQFTPLQLRDAKERAGYTGADLTENPMGGGLSAVRRFEGVQVPTAANRYSGTNRGSFVDPEWDSIGKELRVTLDDDQRIGLEGQLLKIFSAQLPSLPLYFEVQAVPVTGFTGLEPITGVAHTGNIMHTTDAHKWTLAQ